ncbi:hypothetical protein ACHAQK_004309 [Fusarium lateritium]
MWDSFKTGSGPSIHQLPPRELKNRPFLQTQTQPQTQGPMHTQALPQNRSTTSVNSFRSSNKSRDGSNSSNYNYDSQTHIKDDFENRLNGLGIQNGPFRYEIRRGKTVRQPYNSGQPRLSPVLGSDDIRTKAPPRNPRRLQGEDDSPWRPASSVYDDDDRSSRHSRHSDLQKVPRSKVPAKDMYGRPTGLEISPPSSPEFEATKYG